MSYLVQSASGLFAALQAVALFTGALIFAGLSVLMLADFVIWPLRGRRIVGQVIELQASDVNGATYRAVIDYEDAAGATRRAVSCVGSSSLAGRVPGSTISAYVRDDKPAQCWLPLDASAEMVIGLVCMGSAIGLLFWGLHLAQNNSSQWIAVLVMGGIAAYKGAPIVEALRGGRGLQGEQALAAFRAGVAQRAGQQPPPGGPARAAAPSAKAASRVPLYGLSLFGFMFLLLGAFLTWRQASLVVLGRSASGQVIENLASGSSSGATYNARFTFTDAQGAVHTARDPIGTGTPSFAPGQVVGVYYDPRQPERATIDRGIWTIGLPALLPLAGLGILTLGGVLLSRRDRAPPEAAALPLAAAGSQPRALGRDEVLQRMQQYERQALWGVPLAALLGAGLIWLGLHLTQRNLDLMRGGMRADGVVVALDEVVDSASPAAPAYHGRVRFADADEQVHEFRDGVGASTPLQHVGDHVVVLYDAADANHAMIDRGMWNLGVAALPGVGGLLVEITALIGFVRILRRRATAG